MPELENIYEKLKVILTQDNRYSIYAYQFVFEALSFTAKILGKDSNSPHESERHIAGQQLLEGIRKYALDQYGYMAYVVLLLWGVKKDSDFGEIVFNLVENGLMGKTDTDSRKDFSDVYNFKAVFEEQFKFENKFDIAMEFDNGGKVKFK